MTVPFGTNELATMYASMTRLRHTVGRSHCLDIERQLGILAALDSASELLSGVIFQPDHSRREPKELSARALNERRSVFIRAEAAMQREALAAEDTAAEPSAA